MMTAMSWFGSRAARGSPDSMRQQFRNVRSPLTRGMLSKPPGDLLAIQFAAPLADDDYQRLGEWTRQWPNVGLRACGQLITDLEFLRFFRISSASQWIQRMTTCGRSTACDFCRIASKR